MHLTINYSDAGDGWVTAQVAEIPGAISEGKTREEARSNVIDALDVLLTPDEDRLTFHWTGRTSVCTVESPKAGAAVFSRLR